MRHQQSISVPNEWVNRAWTLLNKDVHSDGPETLSRNAMELVSEIVELCAEELVQRPKVILGANEERYRS